MLETLPIFTPFIRPKHRWAFHSCALKTQNCGQAGPNTGNIVQLASAVVNLPEIYAGNPVSVHAVNPAKKSVGIPLLRLEQVKLWLQG
jgi:hypothetical protein